MADISIVNIGTQWGVESVYGTSVAGSKLLSTLGVSRPMPQGSSTPFRPQGVKGFTANVPVGRRRTEYNLAGVMDYGELIYPLNAAIKTVTPTSDGTNGKKWTFAYSRSGADAKSSFTIESGDAVHAQKATGCVVTDLTLDMSWETTQISGKLLGTTMTDDIAMTGSPTAIATNLLNPGTFSVKTAATAAGLTGASDFARPFSAQLAIPGIAQPLNRMNPTDTSQVAMIENPLEGMAFKLVVGADDADMAFLTNWTAGSTVFFRVANTGGTIAGAIPSAYAFQLDVACVAQNPYTLGEGQGAATSEWTFPVIWDATAGWFFSLFVTNTLATL